MKHTFSRSFATRLSIYVLSFTLIVFTTIMVLAYNYSQEKVTNYAIERTHGLLNNMVTEISSQLSSVKTTVNQSLWMLEGGLNHPDSLRHIITEDDIFHDNHLFVILFLKHGGTEHRLRVLMISLG